MVEGDVDNAVAILDVKDHRVAADFTPMADNAHSMMAARHYPGQINGANFEISCNWDGLLYNRRFENSGDDDLLPGFEEHTLAVVIRFADGFSQVRGSEGFCALQIFAGNRRDAVSALGEIKIRAWGRDYGRRGVERFGGIGFNLHELHAMRILDSERRRTNEDCQDEGEQ